MKSLLCALTLLSPLVAIAAHRLPSARPSSEILTLDGIRSAWPTSWRHPAYPEARRQGGARETVMVRFVVDEQGAVVDPEVIRGDEPFAAAALEAISQWKFRPALHNGQPVRVSFDLEMGFNPFETNTGLRTDSTPYLVRPTPTRPPAEWRTPDPEFPAHLVERQLFGEVELLLAIDARGRVEGVEVLRATHVDFLTAALQTVDTWEFRPAASGKVPTVGEQRAVLGFKVMDEETGRPSMEDWLEKNGIRLRDPAALKPVDHFDELPKPRLFVDPIYPATLLDQGIEGQARVDFIIDTSGEPQEITVAEATAPDFGAALRAAVTVWRFEPLERRGEKTATEFSVEWKFTKPAEANTAPAMLAALKARDSLPKPTELDRPLALLARVSPAIPPVLREAGLPGTAKIEILIDRTGRVCWPRVLEASHPDFGWAAATALSRCYFETPKKDGQPVATRAVIPLKVKVD